MVFFVGETNKNRRRAGAYYRPPVPHKRHHHAARGHHYRGHHRQPYYGGVGRMGDAEGEEIDELQRLERREMPYFYFNNTKSNLFL